MSDHSQKQWMQPPPAAQLEGSPRNSQPYGMQYTPNEPDASEAVYAAQAAAARRRAGRLEPEGGMHGTQPSVRPDAVLYRQSTGVVDLPPIPAAPVAPAVPMAADRRPEAPAPLPFRDAEPGADTRRRRRMRQLEEAQAEAEQEEGASLREKAEEAKAAAKEKLAAPQETGSLREKAEAAKQAAKENRTYNRAEALLDAEERYAAQPEEAEPVKPVKPPVKQESVSGKNGAAAERLNIFARRPAKKEEPEEEPQLLVNTSNTPFGLQPGLDWKLTDTFEPDADADEDEDENARYAEDHMDSGRMPVPAPVSTVELPAQKKKSRLPVKLLKAVIVLMLLAAAVSFLWLSGIGQDIATGIRQVYADLTDRTIPTGAMTVVPEAAAVPTTLLVTLSTDNSIADLRLLNDQGKVLEADITCTANGKDTLWNCRVVMDEPYAGFIRAELLNARGEWRIGSSSRYVNIQ